jgi:hypothetical protein
MIPPISQTINPKDPSERSRLLVGFPLYKQVSVSFFSNWLGVNKENVMGTISVNGVYLPPAMNIIVSRALMTEGWERLVIIEGDMIMPLGALARMSQYSPEHDVVGGVYFQHEPPYLTIGYAREDDPLSYSPLTPQTVKDWTDDPALYRIGAVGFGMTSIARHVLENWDPNIPMFDTQNPKIGSHDIWFCHMAEEQGHTIYLDSGIVCKHLSETLVGMEDNQNAPMPEEIEIREFDYATR